MGIAHPWDQGWALEGSVARDEEEAQPPSRAPHYS